MIVLHARGRTHSCRTASGMVRAKSLKVIAQACTTQQRTAKMHGAATGCFFEHARKRGPGGAAKTALRLLCTSESLVDALQRAVLACFPNFWCPYSAVSMCICSLPMARQAHGPDQLPLAFALTPWHGAKDAPACTRPRWRKAVCGRFEALSYSRNGTGGVRAVNVRSGTKDPRTLRPARGGSFRGLDYLVGVLGGVWIGRHLYRRGRDEVWCGGGQQRGGGARTGQWRQRRLAREGWGAGAARGRTNVAAVDDLLSLGGDGHRAGSGQDREGSARREWE